MVVWDLMCSYQGNKSQLHDYICRHLQHQVNNCTDYMYCSELVSPKNTRSSDLTQIPIEDMIDLSNLDSWTKYLLWQSGIEERGIRDIARLTGISKSVIADDLRYIHGNF